MSVFTTMAIARDDARKEITQRLEKATDEQLAEVLGDLVSPAANLNFIVVPDYHSDGVFPLTYRTTKIN